MKGGIAKTSFSALFPLFESCRFFCCCKFLEILRSSSASSLSFFFRHCWSGKSWMDSGGRNAAMQLKTALIIPPTPPL